MEELEAFKRKYLAPSPEFVENIKKLDGDLMILGAGGKMGPSLAILAKEALQKAGKVNHVIAVSRFSDQKIAKQLTSAGVKVVKTDLLKDDELKRLPRVRNIIYMAGTKFGTAGNESFTWIMNSYLPGRIAEHFRSSRIVVFSTGNIYPYVPVYSGGATEYTAPQPLGEYAQSCLGRERVFEHFSKLHQIPVLIYRLNYAIDFSYGVLLEIAKSVLEDREIDLSTGHVNVIWQGDANEYAIRSLFLCESPARKLNITGPETVSVRWAAEEFGRMFEKKPRFVNEEQPDALLSNASEAHKLFGYPKVSLKQMIDILAEWLNQGGGTINKPTHFQERKGSY